MKDLNCRLIRQLCRLAMGVFCLINSMVYAAERAPASFSPDDDVIVVPIEVKQDYMDDLIRDEKGKIHQKVQRMRDTVIIWQSQNEFIQNWKLEDTGYQLPTAQQKEDFFNRQFFRYFTSEAGEPYKDAASNWWDRWNSSQDEIDTASAQQEFNEIGEDEAKKKEITLNNRYKFSFSPRFVRGLVISKLENPYMDIEFLAGINGRADFNLRKTYKTGTTAFVSYQLSNQIFIASIDQKLLYRISARVSSMHDATLTDPKMRNEQSIQLRYNFSF